jgi:methylated-DNA-[protein]-cysteine S-methyltransferase
MNYQIIESGKEEIGLVWRQTDAGPLVEFIYLPGKEKMTRRIARDFPGIALGPKEIPLGLDQAIAGLYEGRKINFDPAFLNWSKLSGFPSRVLRQTYKIPRGKVITYGGLAAKAGNPRASRAAGTALANNPFPIVIPCHRVLRADGSPGNFGGGTPMKKQLLEKEGVPFDDRGRVLPSGIWH